MKINVEMQTPSTTHAALLITYPLLKVYFEKH